MRAAPNVIATVNERALALAKTPVPVNPRGSRRRAKTNILLLALEELDKARSFMLRDSLEADAFRCWTACANVEAAARRR